MRLLILSLIVLLFAMPALAKESETSEYTVFISDQEGFLNVVSVRLIDGRAYATTEKTVNAGDNFAVSPDGIILAEAYQQGDLNTILMSSIEETEAIFFQSQIETQDRVSLHFASNNELAVRYADLEQFEPDHIAWFSHENTTYHIQLPEWMCRDEKVSGRNVLVECNNGYYLIVEGQEAVLLPTNTIDANFCGIDVCLSEFVPANGASFTRYQLSGTELVQLETLAISHMASPMFYLGSHLVHFGVNETVDQLYFSGQENPFARAVSSFSASDDGAIFWINYVDYALHIWKDDVTYGVGLDFNSRAIWEVVEN